MKRFFVLSALAALAVSSVSLSGCSNNAQTIQSSPPPTGVTIMFKNNRPDADTVQAYVGFGGGGAFTGTNLADGSSLEKGVAYPMSQFSSGINITQFISDRIFISLGAGLTTPDEGNGFSPNFDNPNLDDFTTRWDKIEATFVNGVGGANLTSQDFFGIPMDIMSSGGGQSPTHLTWRKDTATVFQSLGMLSNFSVISTTNATGAIGTAPGEIGVTIPGVGENPVIRVISPGSVSPLAGGKTVYQSLAGYVTYLQTGNGGNPVQTTIAGNNGQVAGGAFQTYNLIATVQNVPTTINGTPVAEGDLVLQGTINNGSGDTPYAVLVGSSDLSDYAIYGANPTFQIIEGADFNGITAKVLADYFAALNFGFPGSGVTNPNQNNSTIGASPSWTWYGNNPDGTDQPPLSINAAFSAAQPGQTGRYNLYADYLVGVTDSYGFAYNDRLQSPLASLGDGSVMTITILPDTGLGAANRRANAPGATEEFVARIWANLSALFAPFTLKR